MTKDQLVNKLAENTGETKAAVTAILKNLKEIVLEELKEVGESTIHNLVVLKVKDRAERVGRNPKTGEVLTIAAKKVVTAKATALQTAVQRALAG